MKKKLICNTMLLVGALFFNSCTNEADRDISPLESKTLQLKYEIKGADKMETYAAGAGTPDESKITNIYTFFFDPNNGNRYEGYTLSTANATGAGSGSASVPMPGTLSPGLDVDSELHLLFAANLDQYINLQGEANTTAWMVANLPTGAGLDMADVKNKLKAIADDTNGIRPRVNQLLMTAEQNKPANTNVASIQLSRAVSRIDVTSSAAVFDFQRVQLWSARKHAYVFPDNKMTGVGAGDFVHYKLASVDASLGPVEGKLYAFENHVATVMQGDHVTTCLIVGGYYNNTPTMSWYRINIKNPAAGQALKRNSAYTINIQSVSGAGAATPEQAFDDTQSYITYTINEWDDSFLGTYIFDKDGNGLAVSQRNVTFSDKGIQSVELEVFTIQSSTNPLAGDWTVDAPQGADAAFFTSQKVAIPTNRYVELKTTGDNVNIIDRTAQVNVSWGTIKVPINLTQLNSTSQMGGIKLQPAILWFLMTGGTKEICVNLQGNFSGITRSDIATTVIYQGGQAPWITLASGTTPDNAAAGMFYYNVTASNNSASLMRLADVKFVVTQGSLVATAQTTVTQSTTAPTDPFIRTTNMLMYEKNASNVYVNKGNVVNAFLTFKGLPANTSGANHLHFSSIEHTVFRYELEIQSSQAWKIVPTGYAGTAINFSQYTDPGDTNTLKKVLIEANRDVPVGWSAGFYIEYEDGDKVEYNIHQLGVLATLPVAPQGIYFYGTMIMNGKVWLDRNIGATVGQDLENPTVGYFSTGPATGITNDDRAKGAIFNNSAIALASCPKGFAVLSGLSANYVSSANFSGSGGDLASGGISHPNVAYIRISTNPAKFWYIPITGHSHSYKTYGWEPATGYARTTFSWDPEHGPGRGAVVLVTSNRTLSWDHPTPNQQNNQCPKLGYWWSGSGPTSSDSNALAYDLPTYAIRCVQN